MAARLIKLVRDARGATAIEYGMIVAMVVIAMVVALSTVGNSNSGGWAIVSNKISNAITIS